MFKLKEIAASVEALEASFEERFIALESKLSDQAEEIKQKESEIAGLKASAEEKAVEIEQKEAAIEAKSEDLEVKAEVKAVEKLADIGHNGAVEEVKQEVLSFEDHMKIWQSMKPGTERAEYGKKHVYDGIFKK